METHTDFFTNFMESKPPSLETTASKLTKLNLDTCAASVPGSVAGSVASSAGGSGGPAIAKEKSTGGNAAGGTGAGGLTQMILENVGNMMGQMGAASPKGCSPYDEPACVNDEDLDGIYVFRVRSCCSSGQVGSYCVDLIGLWSREEIR